MVDIFVKLNLNINVKNLYKTTIIQNMCCEAFVNGWVLNLENLSETRTFFQTLYFHFQWFILFLSQLTLIFRRKISCKTGIKKTMAQIVYDICKSSVLFGECPYYGNNRGHYEESVLWSFMGLANYFVMTKYHIFLADETTLLPTELYLWLVFRNNLCI